MIKRVPREPARTSDTDPYLSVRFKVEIDSIDVAGFNEITGLTFETNVEKFREGGLNTHEHQLAGPTQYSSRISLKRGLSDLELWTWYQEIMGGRINRKDVSIILLDSVDNEKYRRRWTFRQAYPIKWDGPRFRAGTAEIAFETVELVHEGFLES